MSPRRAAFLASTLAVAVAWVSACGGAETGTAKERGAGGSAGASMGGAGGTGADGGVTGGSGPFLDSGIGGTSGGECTTSAQCDGGICVEGRCCAAAERVCGAVCCGEGEVCSFDRCVVPGAPCRGAADCGPGRFCEPALGEGEADAGPADAGPGCTAPVPPRGRCLEMPPVCGASDGGAPDGGACVEKCEYKPPPGKLDARVKWQWGLVNPPSQFPASADVWATPTVGRLTDSNCDGAVDSSDPPNIVFVSGNANRTCCSCDGSAPSTCLTGVLRVLDGASGKEIWSLPRARPGVHGFAGLSVALGDVDGDLSMDVVAMTGDGHVVLIDATGTVKRISDLPVDGSASPTFGWGGGLALGDMEGDGSPEIAYGRTVFSTAGGAITRRFVGTGGRGGGGNGNRDLSFFADVDHDGVLELVAGNTVYEPDGSVLWTAPAGIADGFPAVADFDGVDGRPEVVLVVDGRVYLLNGLDGTVRLGPVTLPGTGFGGPPTVADFDGDGRPEIGVAQQNLYSMLKPNFATNAIDVVWQAPNHDLSSSVTGSSVFDFEGDGKAEVIYNDECFLWVYDGTTGAVLLAANTTSFTATEASLVADVDGDGHAEIVMVSNGADPSATGWKCDMAPWNQPDVANNRGAWIPPPGAPAYRGITVYGDRSNSWVGTRSLWNQHAYSVSNVCDSRDSACDAPNVYGSIPPVQKKNWTVPWLNNFRQNVQDQGLFDAPDAVVSLTVDCIEPPTLHAKVQNVGLAGLPSGVVVEFFAVRMGAEVSLGTATTTIGLLPGQSQVVTFQPVAGAASTLDRFRARIQNAAPKAFNECREDNNASKDVETSCGPR